MYSINRRESKFTVQKDHQYYHIRSNAYQMQLAVLNVPCLNKAHGSKYLLQLVDYCS